MGNTVICLRDIIIDIDIDTIIDIDIDADTNTDIAIESTTPRSYRGTLL